MAGAHDLVYVLPKQLMVYNYLMQRTGQQFEFSLCIQDVTAYGSLQPGFDKATFKTCSNTPSIKRLALPRNQSFSPLLSMPLSPVLNKLSESYLFMYLPLQLSYELCNRRKYVRFIFVSSVPITELDK